MLPQVSRELKALRELEINRDRQARRELKVIKKANKKLAKQYARHVEACKDCKGTGEIVVGSVACKSCKGLGYKKKKK